MSKLPLLDRFREFEKLLRAIDGDHTLQREAHTRGYTLTESSSVGAFDTGHLLSSFFVIDTRGGGAWSKNIFYHPSRGWFLLDW